MAPDPEATHSRRVGRPRVATPEKTSEIEHLRVAGLTWPEIGTRLALNPETCRRALWAVKKSRRGVGNPADPVNKSACVEGEDHAG
jgi:hypothetical protein